MRVETRTRNNEGYKKGARVDVPSAQRGGMAGNVKATMSRMDVSISASEFLELLRLIDKDVRPYVILGMSTQVAGLM